MVRVDGYRLLWACVLIAGAWAALTWCSVSYGRANPERRVPGKLPDTVQPPGFMPLGMVGIVCAILGGLAAVGSFSGLTWLIAGAVIVGGLVPFQLRHNSRLRR